MSILAVMEQRGGAWNRMSFETLAAAQQLAGELNTPASAAVLGQGIDALAGELAGEAARKGLRGRARAAEGLHAGRLTPSALRQLIAQAKPAVRAVSAHLPGARFPAQAGHGARPRAR